MLVLVLVRVRVRGLVAVLVCAVRRCGCRRLTFERSATIDVCAVDMVCGGGEVCMDDAGYRSCSALVWVGAGVGWWPRQVGDVCNCNCLSYENPHFRRQFRS